MKNKKIYVYYVKINLKPKTGFKFKTIKCELLDETTILTKAGCKIDFSTNSILTIRSANPFQEIGDNEYYTYCFEDQINEAKQMLEEHIQNKILSNKKEIDKLLKYVGLQVSLSDYIKDVKKQLTINASDEYKSEYITYDFTNEQIDDNLDYFNDCKIDGLSPYKSLLFFQDYLNEKL